MIVFEVRLHTLGNLQGFRWRLQVQDRKNLSGAVGFEIKVMCSDLFVRELAQGFSMRIWACGLCGDKLCVKFISGDNHKRCGFRRLVSWLCYSHGYPKSFIHPNAPL